MSNRKPLARPPRFPQSLLQAAKRKKMAPLDLYQLVMLGAAKTPTSH